jgi:competence protein ComEC
MNNTYQMKNKLFLIPVFLCLFGHDLFGQILEIHQINIGQGDASMIVVRDTALLRANFEAKGIPLPEQSYKWLEAALNNKVILGGTVIKAILIDAGESAASASAIDMYMKKLGIASDCIKYYILSHYHKDHQRGFIDLLDKYEIHPDILMLRAPIIKGLAKGTRELLALQIQENPKKDTLHAFHNKTVIGLGEVNGLKMNLTCIGAAMTTAFQTEPLDITASQKNDENNYSLLWALQFGSFRYFTGGDVNGYTKSAKIDLESNLMDALLVHDPASLASLADTNVAINKGHFCSLKLSHHGGEESTNPYFLAVMKPTSAMISCGQQNYKHPRQRIIEDLDSILKPKWDLTTYATRPLVKANGDTMVTKTIRNYFLTNLNKLQPDSFYVQIGDSTKSKGIIAGDIVTVIDSSNPLESAYYVFWNGEKAVTVVSKPEKLYEPNKKGGKYIRCHISKDTPLPLQIKNH